MPISNPPIRNLPIVNRALVISAPVRTSRQAKSTSGRTLKIIANNRAATPKPTRLLRIVRITAAPENPASSQDPSAVSPASRIRDTSRRKPIPTTSARLRTRVRTKLMTPDPADGLTFQIRLRSSCNSTIAPVATSRKVATPTTVPTTPEPMLLALWIMASIAAADSLPRRPPSSANDGALSGLAAEHEARDRDGGQQHGGEREDREIGDRRAQAHGAVAHQPSKAARRRRQNSASMVRAWMFEESDDTFGRDPKAPAPSRAARTSGFFPSWSWAIP